MLPQKSKTDQWISDAQKKEVIEMGVLTFNNIMEAEDITEKTLPISEWGGDVIIRSIPYRKLSSLKNSAKSGENVDDDFVEKEMVRLGMINPELTPEEVEMLWDKSSTAIVKLLTAIMGVSKTEEKDQKEAEKSLPSEPE
jgi:hypothetical protein